MYPGILQFYKVTFNIGSKKRRGIPPNLHISITFSNSFPMHIYEVYIIQES